MKAAGIVLIAFALAWIAFGGVRVARPGEPVHMRPARRFHGILLLAGGVLLLVTALALVAR